PSPRGADRRAHRDLLACAAAPPPDRTPGRRHLAQHAPRARAPTPRHARRRRRPGPADHPPDPRAARHPQPSSRSSRRPRSPASPPPDLNPAQPLGTPTRRRGHTRAEPHKLRKPAPQRAITPLHTRARAHQLRNSGKTTSTFLVGNLLAGHLKLRVVAVDANPDFGTL